MQLLYDIIFLESLYSYAWDIFLRKKYHPKP